MEKVDVDFYNQIDDLKKTLLSSFNNCKKVFIFPHNHMDFDALASSIALSDICNFFGISNYIVTNDKYDDANTGLSKTFLQLRDKYNFINSNTFDDLRNDDDLFIISDTCVKNLLPVNVEDYGNNIIIIDHHNPDDKLVKADNYFINTDACSASEILFFLMKKLDIYISNQTCQLLLAGIYLDTNGLKYMHNQSSRDSFNKLLNYGANVENAKDLIEFSESEEKIIDELVKYHSIYHDYQGKCFAIAFNKENPNMIYTDGQLACACESLLDSTVDVAFVIGHVGTDNCQKGIAIKARSKFKPDTEDVSAIMQIFNGGGDTYRAACVLEAPDLPYAKDEIKKILKSSPENRCKQYILERKD